MPCPEKCLKVTLKESRGLHRENHPDEELQEKPLDTPYPSDICSYVDFLLQQPLSKLIYIIDQRRHSPVPK